MAKTRQKFGGDWTQQKLARVRKYLQAYMTVMKNRPYKLAYVDAFAGTGYVELNRFDCAAAFPELAEPETQRFIEGSARQALQIQPPFHQYEFVETRAHHCQQLAQLKSEFPSLGNSINVQRQDANAFLMQFCGETSWSEWRAVLFLDPFGMSVNWTTVEAIAKTRAIDMWYLFPLGVAVGRLLRKDGAIPEEWRNRLNAIFGAEDWYDAFYCSRTEEGLFGSLESTEKTADYDAISRYFVERLRTVFLGVAENPLPLYNRTRIPLFLLCFASANPHAKAAVKIARHILGSGNAVRK